MIVVDAGEDVATDAGVREADEDRREKADLVEVRVHRDRDPVGGVQRCEPELRGAPALHDDGEAFVLAERGHGVRHGLSGQAEDVDTGVMNRIHRRIFILIR